ncbi:neprosin family prolyl endopeptidase [Tahibacter amnicola]|uniref:Neprosin family prolyl endopeptidase n=1 Tax=Tahibacter amnicola TaxID=2976241 RepID=A0ABY6BAK0_9GAMM|nr:neprosin family prolyl endopeptidase [Tahibacter amnicola]UXI66178.1 neprosin family prolyl endopeptidase [Tahibacter amnicola]
MNDVMRRYAGVSALLLLLAAPISHAQAGSEKQEAPAVQDDELDPDEYQRRKIRIVKFFEDQRARYEVVTSTVTKSGQILDWIKPESQTEGGAIASPPREMYPHPYAESVSNPYLDAAKHPIRKEGVALTELQLDGAAMGPPGTVPIVRFDIDSYLNEVRYLPADPLDIVSKLPPPAPSSNNRYYAVWHRFGDVFGTIGRVNIWDTEGPVGNETSIAQTAVIRGTPMQAIEAGKIETSGFSPARRPVFFTYYRTAGSASGDWAGGYNTLVQGWVQVSPTVAPGMSLIPWASATDGEQYSLDVEVRLWEGNWWVRAAGEWVGYYPHCIGGAAPPCERGTLFSEKGIRDIADRLDWYGEVFDSRAPAATSTDMGSGAYANTHFRRAAYFRNLLYVWAPATAWWFDAGSISVTDARCYSADGPFYSADPNWRNWFYYGGPGDEGAGCD